MPKIRPAPNSDDTDVDYGYVAERVGLDDFLVKCIIWPYEKVWNHLYDLLRSNTYHVIMSYKNHHVYFLRRDNGWNAETRQEIENDLIALWSLLYFSQRK